MMPVFSEQLQRIGALQQAIDGHGKLPPELLKRITYLFRLEWNYYSNRMEGNTLTLEETRAVMVNNLYIENKSFREIAEMHGHDEVVTQALRIGRGELNISEKRIKEIHKAILYEEDPRQRKKIGAWKQTPNYLYNYRGERIDFTEPADVPEAMHSLVNWLHAEQDKILRKAPDALHPVQIAFGFHLRYVSIHPFHDGNGRTARILTNLILIAAGYPPVYVKDEDRETYGRLLADVQVYGGEPDLFFSFMAGLLIRSQELMLDIIEGRRAGEPGSLETDMLLLKRDLSGKEQAAVPRSAAVLRSLFLDGILPLAEELERKTVPLHELFARTETRLSIDGMGDLSQEWAAIRHPSDPRLRPLLDSMDDRSAEMIRGAMVLLVFSGLKVQLAPRELYIRVEFTFGEYACTLVHPDGLQRSYPYTGSRLQAARSQLAEGWIGKLLGEIRQAGGLA